jgi:DNA-binding response OmpR family regulator
VNLNLRCSLLKQHGGKVLSSGSGHDGILRFGQEVVDAVVVDISEGVEAALIIGELKRLRPEVPVIFVKEADSLAEEATLQANAVVLKSRESVDLINTLKAVLPPRSESKS